MIFDNRFQAIKIVFEEIQENFRLSQWTKKFDGLKLLELKYGPNF